MQSADLYKWLNQWQMYNKWICALRFNQPPCARHWPHPPRPAVIVNSPTPLSMENCIASLEQHTKLNNNEVYIHDTTNTTRFPPPYASVSPLTLSPYSSMWPIIVCRTLRRRSKHFWSWPPPADIAKLCSNTHGSIDDVVLCCADAQRVGNPLAPRAEHTHTQILDSVGCGGEALRPVRPCSLCVYLRSWRVDDADACSNAI